MDLINVLCSRFLVMCWKRNLSHHNKYNRLCLSYKIYDKKHMNVEFIEYIDELFCRENRNRMNDFIYFREGINVICQS